MIKKYNKLFQIDLHHSYFREGVPKELTIKPSPVTGQLMSKLDLRLVTRNTGYEVYWASEKRGEEDYAPVKLINHPIILNFVVQTDDPYFLNYTDLSLAEETRGHRCYFNNQETPSGGELSTSDPSQANHDTKVAGDADLRAFGNSQQMIEFDPFDEGDDQLAILLDMDGNIVSSGPIPDQQLQSGKYLLDLTEEDWGYYDFIIAKSEDAADGLSYPIYYLPDQAQQRGLGLIQIVFDPATLSVAEDEQSPLQYKLSFAERYTKWRYIFMDSNNLSYTQIRLMLNEQELNSLLPSAEDLQNEPTKYTISLQEARPLQEIYTETIKAELLRAADGADPTAAPEVILTLAIPSPDNQRIYPVRTNGNLEFYSDMYIYV